MTLAEDILAGNARAAARLISLLEDGSPDAAAEMDALGAGPGTAHIIGITGAPGTGKSTLAAALISHYREPGLTIGVIAIDPSSAFTGGAMLGDRLRMQAHSADPAVFIRSLATRGWAGGLARAATGAIRVLDALGKDVILIETVGAGQVEVDIAAVADTTLVVLNPGAGDDIQTLKAGIMETADIYVINKADREGADRLKADLDAMLAMKPRPAGEWVPPVVLTEAVNGSGATDLAEAAGQHREYLTSTGRLTQRRRGRIHLELLTNAEGLWQALLRELDGSEFLDSLIEDVSAGRTSPYRAAKDVAHRLAAQVAEEERRES